MEKNFHMDFLNVPELFVKKASSPGYTIAMFEMLERYHA